MKSFSELCFKGGFSWQLTIKLSKRIREESCGGLLWQVLIECTLLTWITWDGPVLSQGTWGLYLSCLCVYCWVVSRICTVYLCVIEIYEMIVHLSVNSYVDVHVLYRCTDTCQVFCIFSLNSHTCSSSNWSWPDLMSFYLQIPSWFLISF